MVAIDLSNPNWANPNQSLSFQTLSKPATSTGGHSIYHPHKNKTAAQTPTPNPNVPTTMNQTKSIQPQANLFQQFQNQLPFNYVPQTPPEVYQKQKVPFGQLVLTSFKLSSLTTGVNPIFNIAGAIASPFVSKVSSAADTVMFFGGIAFNRYVFEGKPFQSGWNIKDRYSFLTKQQSSMASSLNQQNIDIQSQQKAFSFLPAETSNLGAIQLNKKVMVYNTGVNQYNLLSEKIGGYYSLKDVRAGTIGTIAGLTSMAYISGVALGGTGISSQIGMVGKQLIGTTGMKIAGTALLATSITASGVTGVSRYASYGYSPIEGGALGIVGGVVETGAFLVGNKMGTQELYKFMEASNKAGVTTSKVEMRPSLIQTKAEEIEAIKYEANIREISFKGKGFTKTYSDVYGFEELVKPTTMKGYVDIGVTSKNPYTDISYTGGLKEGTIYRGLTYSKEPMNLGTQWISQKSIGIREVIVPNEFYSVGSSKFAQNINNLGYVKGTIPIDFTTYVGQGGEGQKFYQSFGVLSKGANSGSLIKTYTTLYQGGLAEPVRGLSTIPTADILGGLPYQQSLGINNVPQNLAIASKINIGAVNIGANVASGFTRSFPTTMLLGSQLSPLTFISPMTFTKNAGLINSIQSMKMITPDSLITPIQSPLITQPTNVTPRYIQGISTIQIQAPVQIQPLATAQTQAQSLISPNLLTNIPSYPFFPFLTIPSFRLGGGDEDYGKGFKGGKKRTGFTPSFSAFAFGLKGSYKTNKLSKSGLDFRPFTSKFKIFKNKRIKLKI